MLKKKKDKISSKSQRKNMRNPILKMATDVHRQFT